MPRKPKPSASDKEVEGKAAPKKYADNENICTEALKRYAHWLSIEQENVNQAYEDLEFRAGKQWPANIEKERADEERPILTINGIPKFVRQVTGDMRQMKPSIKVVPVDSRGDPETAELEAGMIRYIENRSDAQAVYTQGADTQVVAGIGHWEVIKEYADDTTFNQELRIVGVSDSIAVAWDPDARLPNREDAKWWIVPVDVSEDSFKERWPDASVDDFDDVTGESSIGWFGNNTVRIAAYWKKKPIKRTLALLKDGTIEDLTDKEPDEIARVKALPDVRVEVRDSYEVVRYLLTAAHVLEGPIKWPGRHIPLIPAIGEEVRIGRKVIRHGLVRFMKDPQRMLNYFNSAHAEVIALQPKAPYKGTEKNFQQYPDQWNNANKKNYPYLVYTPDSANGGVAPQREPPPVSSQGIAEGLLLSAQNMKEVIGIYDAGIGNKSNETSGRAIMARDRQSDTGTYVYIDNFGRAVRRTGTILIDLIPHVYDTERMIRIVGEDGKVELKWINKPTGLQEQGDDGEMSAMGKVENDVTVGAYDVVLETGPSYATKREEAREGMTEFIRSSPESAPIILDLVAKAQDWPLADEIAERFEAMAPPPIQKMLAEKKQGQNAVPGQPPQPIPPSPQEQAQQAAVQLELENKHLLNEKIKAEIAKIGSEAQAHTQGGGVDPVQMVKARSEQQRMQIEGERAKIEFASMQSEMAFKERIAAVQLETALVDLAIKKAGMQIDTASATLDMQGRQQGLEHDAQKHTASLVQGMEKHSNAMEQGAESHAAKVAQMSARPEGQPK